ncbi:MAG: D-2-hydroxyacid dehydrogenase [Thermodesulfobacteriota bacterium]|nr:D-2-hydroxyacid dehydrogenase [Thermodesulfobacteriota bacterium]
MNSHSVKTILITINLDDHHIDSIRVAAPGCKLFITHDRKDLVERINEFIPEIEVVLGMLPRDKTLRDRILGAPHLRWVQQFGAGANWLMEHPEIVEGELIVTNASGVHAIPISEHILAFMFALSRDIHQSIREQSEHRWNRRHSVLELEESTIGIIGVGSIGEKTAEKAKALNMRVLGIRRHPEHASCWVDSMYGPDGLIEVLSQSDWVVITVPLTRETEGLIGENELKVMKQSAFIINIGRGPIIQEKVLIKALKGGWIAGAGLDVFEEEPLPSDSSLWDMKNVIITSHYAGTTPRYNDRMIEIFTENLGRFQAGKTLMNVIDKRLGY